MKKVCNNQLKTNINRFSSKILLVTLASSMIVVPTLYAIPTNYEIATQAETSAVSIIDSQGWLESASVNWDFVSNATGYNVYYKSSSASDSAYVQLDTQLIRQYSNYMRADVVGLAAGNYVIKIVPIINGKEASSKQAITSTLTVQANTREGFAFSKVSPMGTGSGGYNDNGTIPSEAQIIYITADTVNTVQTDVITNSKGATTTCTGLVDILAKRQKGYDKRPMIIRMVGTIKDSDINGLNSSGYIQLKGCYNLTFEGIGEDATVYGWGFLIRDSHNIELRNLGIMLFKDDAISLDTGNENIWVHNNDIFYGAAGSDADQVKGDGSCDVKGLSTYVTISYNHFYDSGKASLCGMSDSEEFFVTYHHNWFDHSDSRHPRIRVGTVHIYNNYFDGNSKYGVGITKGGSAFVEANSFRNCKYPMLISLQGSDIADGNPGTFSKEAGGMIKAYNNDIVGAKSIIYAGQDSKQFDAYLASSRNEKVPTSYQTISGSNKYNNFDTASTMYAYTPDAPQNVPSMVATYSGRVNGGDFDWTFTTADDTDYGVNAALMAKIKNYKSDLVSIGGGSLAPVPTVAPTAIPTATPTIVPTAIPTATPTIVPTAVPTATPTIAPTAVPTATPTIAPTSTPTQFTTTHNFTTNGKQSDYFAITGNLSTTKGTVTYDGQTLTQCLKIESSTNISFTTTDPTTLTLVLNDTFSGNILVDGTKYTANSGIVTVSLNPGTHSIKKADTTNLFYIKLVSTNNF